MNINVQGKKYQKNALYKLLPRFCYYYYPQTLLEERTSEIKKNDMDNLIDDDLDSSSSDESDNESDHYELKKSS